MAFSKNKKNEIYLWLLEGIDKKQPGFINSASSHFSISRTTIHKYLNNLNKEKIIKRKQQNKIFEYSLVDKSITFELNLNEKTEEHIVWQNSVLPFLTHLKQNVLSICEYGFSEILNNAIDHSEADKVFVDICKDVLKIKITISDKGIGIFNKIQKFLKLPNPSDAILELAKGKFTTDPQRHSGEGIFFSSRAFDFFMIRSSKLAFISKKGDDWLFENKNEIGGTSVTMEISTNSETSIKNIFDQYASEDFDYSFSKTKIPIKLLEIEGGNLLSRSQVKRLVTRFERFKYVILDFKDVDYIGQAFADELFRVFQNKHPEVELAQINANEDIIKMINRVKTQESV